MPVNATQTTVATATSMPWVPLNFHESDAPVRVLVSKSASFARTMQVQFTLDQVMDAKVSAVPVTAFETTDGSSALIAAPVAAVRMVIAGSGSATAAFRVLQGGI